MDIYTWRLSNVYFNYNGITHYEIISLYYYMEPYIYNVYICEIRDNMIHLSIDCGFDIHINKTLKLYKIDPDINKIILKELKNKILNKQLKIHVLKNVLMTLLINVLIKTINKLCNNYVNKLFYKIIYIV